MSGMLKTGDGGYWWERAVPNTCTDTLLILRFGTIWLTANEKD